MKSWVLIQYIVGLEKALSHARLDHVDASRGDLLLTAVYQEYCKANAMLVRVAKDIRLFTSVGHSGSLPALSLRYTRKKLILFEFRLI